MPSPAQLKLIQNFLNLPNIKVIDYTRQENVGMIIQVLANHKAAICPRCKTKSEKLHQNHSFLVRDLPFSNQEVYLKVTRRQFKCQKCQKPFSEEIDFIKTRRSYTKRLAAQIVEQVLNSNIKTVAEQNNLSQDIVERMLKDIASEKLKEKPKNLKKLGIDEIALVKGHGNYCAVLIDLEQGKLIGMLPSRKQEDLKQYLKKWGKEILEEIEAVSIDLWKSYKTLIQELMPQAEIIADRFHVMKAINTELDMKRKTIKKKAYTQKNKSEKILDALSKSKYALLKNEKDLTEIQKEKLKKVKQEIPILGKMHEIKEEFREILDKNYDWLTGLDNLSEWLLAASTLFPNSSRTIIRWFSEIMGYFESRITQGVVEGINNKLKLIKRSGYGFKNFENFKLRCLLNWAITC
ncbi:ISL3 family transposase [Gloeothece verrucosa]|uniref:Transposase IS204/IS1001/IS1096/IS1165 family protein n=1 Tax=Gloeothece verrucosa (strain PCC 7822) TaxID=497965 RepID=E0UME2_GLOV7|nr:ISL3 family transposase [Gloeothece verrucosa]ADN18122.1 transposase IS204/IS1001/IS1096/IS1165 family protein [Gloeothece verrucosa PCC 7822]